LPTVFNSKQSNLITFCLMCYPCLFSKRWVEFGERPKTTQ
jgi:hypothetical protein